MNAEASLEKRRKIKNKNVGLDASKTSRPHSNKIEQAGSSKTTKLQTRQLECLVQKHGKRQRWVIKTTALPNHIRNIKERTNPENVSDKQKEEARKRKQRYAEKVGWQPRNHHHRHQHQAVREQRLVNYLNNLPLDFDPNEYDYNDS